MHCTLSKDNQQPEQFDHDADEVAMGIQVGADDGDKEPFLQAIMVSMSISVSMVLLVQMRMSVVKPQRSPFC